MKASVIIPTRNRGKALLETVDSVLDQSYPADDYEVIIVDSSTDNTPILLQESLARRSRLPEIRFLHEKLLGLHYAKNKGVRASQGDVVAVIEDDAIADRNWLAELLKPFDDPQVVCSGGKVLPRWEANPPSWIKPHYIMLTIFDLGDEIQELNIPTLVGCSLAVKRDVLLKVGGYNPDIMGAVLVGDGETGLQRKIIRNKAGKLVYNPSAIVWHCIPARRLTLEYMRWRFYNEGTCAAQGLYQERHPGHAELLFYAGKRATSAVVYKVSSLLHAYRRDASFYRHELYALHQWRQVLYFFQLIYDRSFREFVAREDWINGGDDGT